MVDAGCALFDQQGSHCQQRLDVTFRFRLDSNGPDSAYQDMVDALGISLVALVVANKRLYELGIHQPDSMAECLQFAGPVLGAAACLHADKAFAAIGKALQHLIPFDLHVGDLTGLRIAAIDLKHAFGNVDADELREVAKLIKIRHEGLL